MKYALKNNKYVFCKEGVYFALTKEQVAEMRDSCEEILNAEGTPDKSEDDSGM